MAEWVAAARKARLGYLLEFDGSPQHGVSGKITGDLISTLPMRVTGLNDRWSAVLYDRTIGKARPVGVFEQAAWATVVLHDKLDAFVGHPVTCDAEDVILQVTQTGERAWNVEVHNPSDKARRVRLTVNPHFDPLVKKHVAPVDLDVPAGASVSHRF